MTRNKIIKILKARVAYHIYFWCIIFCFMVLNHLDMEMSSVDIITRTIISMGLILIHVYFHLFVFQRFFSRKQHGLYILFLILIIAVYVVMKNLVAMTFYNAEIKIFRNVYLIGTYLVITTSLKIGKTGFDQRLMLQRIKAQHIQTELELLKSQINPHFLFNTLNNLFGRVRKLDETIAGGIAQLSHLMRYMIYETNVEKIELEKEVLQVHRLIELQKLRFLKDDDVAIDFKINGDIKNVYIPPMLLLPFVENAFKHGISLEEPSFVDIHLIIMDNTLQFSVKNSIHDPKEEVEDADAGLGLRNVRRRLELLFPETHELKVQDSNNEFEVELTLNL